MESPRQFSPTKAVVTVMTVALALACVSCSRTIYPVSGKVTHNGVPAAGAAVFFVRQGGESNSEPTIMGIVQEDGSFELVCGSLGKGAPAGKYDVLIEWRSPIGPENVRPQRGPDKLNGRYADRQRPLLYASVEARANDLPPFQLADTWANPTWPK
jgi:hypothetical protein